jgi:hypothetical protein
MPDPRLTLSRRRFLAVSSLGLASAAFVGRGLAVRGNSRRQLVDSVDSVVPPVPSGPILSPEEPTSQPLADYEDNQFPTEAEAYAEFIASLELRHITPREVIEPHWSDFNGVSNQLPPTELWRKLPATLRVADEIRSRLNVPLLRITSAYRSPLYNKQIPGSASNSFHTTNQALDLVFACSARRSAEVARQLREEGFFKGGIGVYSTFIHVDTRGKNATWRKA